MNDIQPTYPAKYWISTDDGASRCLLCPHSCLLGPGETGKCGCRQQISDQLVSLNYGYPSAIHMDPIEKKPLYHFHPGKKILSIGSWGCNLSCTFCQNHELSRTISIPKDKEPVSPEDIINQAISLPGNVGIAFTYNEPVVWFEYMEDIARLAHENSLVTVMVSNGYINPAPLNELLGIIDAFNIDLKAYTNDFYKEIAGGTLSPVLRTLKTIHQSKKHLEITHLVIPGQNDSLPVFRQMVNWIEQELGKDTVLHLSRYHPSYQFHAPPTSIETIFELTSIAREKLHHVYPGNVPSERNDTRCPVCKSIVITRIGYFTSLTGLTNKGRCTCCGEMIVPVI
jgi:pyruvate formate lyase activating enzyme